MPGQSLVFGALELCLCTLVRKLPQLSPKLAGSPTGRGGQTCSLSNTDCRLVTSALAILSELPSICSPEGKRSRELLRLLELSDYDKIILLPTSF